MLTPWLSTGAPAGVLGSISNWSAIPSPSASSRNNIAITTTGTFDVVDAGTQSVTLAQSYTGTTSNYTITDQSAKPTAVITAKAITISGITANGKIYNGENDVTLNIPTPTSLGFITRDIIAITTTGTFSDKNAGDGKTVTLTSSYSGSVGNYTITDQISTTANITAKALTGVTIGSSESTYGSSLNPGTVSFTDSNKIGSDILTATANVNTSTLSAGGKPIVGTYTQTANSISGLDSGNYSFAGVTSSANYTINKLALTVSGVTASNKVYNGNTDATLSVSGATFTGISGDKLTVVTSTITGTFVDKNVGDGKSITLSGATLTGDDAGNYTLTGVRGVSANITPKPVTTSLTGTISKEYNQGDSATLTSANYNIDTGITGETITVNKTSGTYNNKNVGTSKPVTVNLQNSDYSITGTDTLLANYTLTTENVTGNIGTITAKAITISGIAADYKIYDGNNIATINIGSAVGWIPGDNIVVSASGTFSDKNAGDGKTVTLTSSYGGTDTGNYTITNQTSTTADIRKATLTISAVKEDKIYNGTTTSAAIPTFDGLVTGDSGKLTGLAQVFNSANVNGINGSTLSVSTYTLDSSVSGNYTVGTITALGTISKAAITISTSNVTKTYDASLVAAGTATITSGTLYNNVSNGGILDSISSGTFEFTNANAGTNKTITVSGVTVNDGNGGNNYAVTYANNTTSTINRADLTVTGVTNNVTYNASAQTNSGAIVSGRQGSDAFVISGYASVPSVTFSGGGGTGAAATAVLGTNATATAVLTPTSVASLSVSAAEVADKLSLYVAALVPVAYPVTVNASDP